METRKLFSLDQLQFLEAANIYTLLEEKSADRKKDDDMKKFYLVMKNLADDVKQCEQEKSPEKLKDMQMLREAAAREMITRLRNNQQLPIEVKIMLLEKAYYRPAFQIHLTNGFKWLNQGIDMFAASTKRLHKETGSQTLIGAERDLLRTAMQKADQMRASEVADLASDDALNMDTKRQAL